MVYKHFIFNLLDQKIGPEVCATHAITQTTLNKETPMVHNLGVK